jgi:hypothetical protein
MDIIGSNSLILMADISHSEEEMEVSILTTDLDMEAMLIVGRTPTEGGRVLLIVIIVIGKKNNMMMQHLQM